MRSRKQVGEGQTSSLDGRHLLGPENPTGARPNLPSHVKESKAAWREEGSTVQSGQFLFTNIYSVSCLHTVNRCATTFGNEEAMYTITHIPGHT